MCTFKAYPFDNRSWLDSLHIVSNMFGGRGGGKQNDMMTSITASLHVSPSKGQRGSTMLHTPSYTHAVWRQSFHSKMPTHELV